MAKFAINASGAMLLPNLIQVSESISGSVVPLAMFLSNMSWRWSSPITHLCPDFQACLVVSAYASVLGAGCRVLGRGNTFSFNLKVPTLPLTKEWPYTLQGPHVKMMTLLTIRLLPEDVMVCLKLCKRTGCWEEVTLLVKYQPTRPLPPAIGRGRG